MNALMFTNSIGLAVLGAGFVGTAGLISRYVRNRHFPFREVATLAGLGCLSTGMLLVTWAAERLFSDASFFLHRPLLVGFLVWTAGISVLAALVGCVKSFRAIASWNEEVRKLRQVDGKKLVEPAPGWRSLISGIDLVWNRLWKIRISDSDESHH